MVVPVESVVAGIPRTKVEVIFYTFIFALAAILFGIVGYAGIIYVVLMALAAVAWCLLALGGVWQEDSGPWARMMFFASLAVIVVFSVALSLS